MKFPREEYPHTYIGAWLTDAEIAALEAINCKDLKCTISLSVMLEEEQGKRRPRSQMEQMKRYPDRVKEAQKHLEKYPSPNSLASYLFNAVVQLRKEAAGVLRRVDA